MRTLTTALAPAKKHRRRDALGLGPSSLTVGPKTRANAAVARFEPPFRLSQGRSEALARRQRELPKRRMLLDGSRGWSPRDCVTL